MSDEDSPLEQLFGKPEHNADGEQVFDVGIDEFPNGKGFDIRYSGAGFGIGGCQVACRNGRIVVDTECTSVETLAAIIKQGAHQIALALYRMDARAWAEHPVPLPAGYRTSEEVLEDLAKQGIIFP